jgi:hypothetical protein
MATAPSALRTATGNLCLSSAPDSGGIWFPEDEHQVPFTRFLDEPEQARQEWFELGPYGCLPTDPRRPKPFAIVEQDLYPCAPEVPLPIAAGTRAYPNGHGPSGTGHPNPNR